MPEKIDAVVTDAVASSNGRDGAIYTGSGFIEGLGDKSEEKSLEGALPRIVLRDKAGGVLNTDTAVQREVHRSWLKLRRGEATEEKDWRLPGLPVPVRPDLSRAAPEWIPQDSVAIESNNLRDPQEHWKTQFGKTDGITRPRCASNLHPTIRGVLGPLYTPLYCTVEGCLNHPHRFKRPYLPPFVYPAPVYTSQRGREAGQRGREAGPTAGHGTRIREYVFPGFCTGCQRHNGIRFCAGCDNDPEPHYHRDKMVRTGGGFSYFRRDPLAVTLIGKPLIGDNGVRSSEQREGVTGGRGGGSGWRAMLNNVPYVFYDGAPIPSMDEYGVAVSVNQLYRDIFQQFEQQSNKKSDTDDSSADGGRQGDVLPLGPTPNDDDEYIPSSVYPRGFDPFEQIPEPSADRRIKQRHGVLGKRKDARSGLGLGPERSSRQRFDPDLNYVLKQREKDDQGLAARLRAENLEKSMRRKLDDPLVTAKDGNSVAPVNIKNEHGDLEHAKDLPKTSKPSTNLTADQEKHLPSPDIKTSTITSDAVIKVNEKSADDINDNDVVGDDDDAHDNDVEGNKANKFKTEEQNELRTTSDTGEKAEASITSATGEGLPEYGADNKSSIDNLQLNKKIQVPKTKQDDKKSLKKTKRTSSTASSDEISTAPDPFPALLPRPVSTILEDDQSVDNSTHTSSRGSQVKSKLSRKADTKRSTSRPKSDLLQASSADQSDSNEASTEQSGPGKRSPAVKRVLKERSTRDSSRQSKLSVTSTVSPTEAESESRDQEEEEEFDEQEEVKAESDVSDEDYYIEPRLPPLPVTSATEPPPFPKSFPPVPPRMLDFTELTKPGRETITGEPEVPPDFSDPRKQRAVISLPAGQHFKHSSNKTKPNHNNMAATDPTAPDTSSAEPTDLLSKYCIIHPDRLPMYIRVFEMAISRQLYRYNDVPHHPAPDVATAADDDDNDDNDDVRVRELRAAESRSTAGAKSSLTIDELNKIRNLYCVDQTSLSSQYYTVGMSEGDQAVAKVNYTLDMLIDKYEQLQEQLDTLTVTRIKKLAELTKQKFPELTKIDYKQKSKKKPKKNKAKQLNTSAIVNTNPGSTREAGNDDDLEKTAATASGDGDVGGRAGWEALQEEKRKNDWRRLRPLTDLEIVERLSDKQLKQLNSEKDLNQLNVQMARIHEKLKEVDDRIDKLEDEKKLLQLYARDEHLVSQAARDKKSERFVRQQSALYQKLHPSSEVELNVDELEEALQLINGQLTNQSELHYIFNILNIPGRRRLNLQLFCAVAAMSEKVKQIDPLVRKLINKFDFEALNVKMDKSKELIGLLVEDNSVVSSISSAAGGKISADVIQLELDAAGVPREMSELIVKKFNREKKGATDYLEVLIYIPLFIALHQRILDTPLTTVLDTPQYQL